MIGAWFPDQASVVSPRLLVSDLSCKCKACTTEAHMVWNSANDKAMYLDTFLIVQLERLIDLLGFKPEIKRGFVCKKQSNVLGCSFRHQNGRAVVVKISPDIYSKHEEKIAEFFKVVSVKKDESIFLAVEY